MSIIDALKAPSEVRNAKKGSPDAMKDAQGLHPYEKYGARIDYIYVSEGVRVFDFETVNDSRPGKNLYPSDHFPVVATIEL
jgi:endonuclease/exonuclease/phosphatase family metal-dependent hydrolase